MPVTWHPTRFHPSFTDKAGKCWKVGAKRWKIAKINGTAKNAFTWCLLVVFSLGVLEDFGTENYIWKLDIIQKWIFLMWLLGNNLFQYLQIIY